MSTTSTSQDFITIEPSRTEKNYWADLWRYHELFLILAWRDVSVRYKQTIIGAAWAVVRPFLTMVVFTVIFGRIAALPSGGAPYALMVFGAMLPWSLFSTALGEASNSLLGNERLISKVYFPRLIIPASPVGFSSSIIPEKWRLLYSLNPIVGVIDGFRWSILGSASSIYWPSFASSIAVVTGFLCLGIRTFRKMEKTFADLI